MPFINKKSIINLGVCFILGVCSIILFSNIQIMQDNLNAIRIEAENYQDYYDSTSGNRGKAYRNDDVDIWAMKQGGFRIGAIQPNEWLTYSLDIPEDGTYKIVSRVGSKNKRNREFSVSLNGEKSTTLKFDSAKGKYWQNITSEEIDLSKGNHQVRLDMLSSNFSLDYFELIPVDESTTTDDNDIDNNTDDHIDMIPDVPPIQNSDGLKSVKIGGGGFVTGIVIHPQAADVMYARTDVGGLYRWDAANQDWNQILSVESVGQKVSLAVESVAVDPNNPNIVYAATGAYTHKEPGNILKSVDGGNSWQVLDISLPMGGSQDWRWAGERLAVDPNNSNVVYFGSRTDGLWNSSDGGQSWNQVDTSVIPVGDTFDVTEGMAGVTFIEFDESSPGIAYVGVAGKGVYQTTNGGDTWQSLGGIFNSLVPQQGEVNADGELIVTLYDPQKNSNNGGVWKFGGSSWVDVTPKSGSNYAGLTVNPSDPNTLLTVTYPMTPNDIYRSTDGGDSWTALNNELQDLNWKPDWSFWTLSGDLAVNPSNPNQVWLANGIGVWQTDGVNANNSTWIPTVDGIEETVAFDAVSTPGESSLITAIADFDGFRHDDINVTPTNNHSGEFSTTTSIDYSYGDPNFLVRVGGVQKSPWIRHAGFSIDNGVTWENFGSIQNGTHPENLSFGNVAVSATDSNNIVWQPTNWAAPYYTTDRGQTWNQIDYFYEQFGGGAHTHLWNSQQSLAADSVAGGTFYIYHHNGGKIVRTEDGGKNWLATSQDSLLPWVWQGASIKTMPGVEGDVWVGLNDQGLFRSQDKGDSFGAIAGVDQVEAFGFGKAAPETNNPTLFVAGEVNDQVGVFGSTDLGSTWSIVSGSDEYLGGFTSLTGDMNNFGRVYLGTEGNGFVYGDLMGAQM